MSGHSISSNNHTRKLEIAKELGSGANEITISVEGKGNRRKQMGRRVINSQDVTLNDMTQSLQLEVATGMKIGLA